MGKINDRIRKRIIARYAKKLLKDKDMKAINFKSKTFWAGVAAICTGIGFIVNGDLEAGIQTVLGGVTAIFLKHAVDKKN